MLRGERHRATSVAAPAPPLQSRPLQPRRRHTTSRRCRCNVVLCAKSRRTAAGSCQRDRLRRCEQGLGPFSLLVVSVAGWLNQRQQQVIEYLRVGAAVGSAGKPWYFQAKELAVILREGASIMPNLDWSKCPVVESVPGRLNGAWVFRNTRMPVSAVFENLEAGATIEEIIEQFDITREQINAVLEFAARSLDAPVPASSR
jgi:uncharacterized protein (DUF433 family)